MADPSPHDVLSGRGVSFNRHPGNEHFRTLLEAQADAYSTGTKKQKMAISKSIVEMIYSRDPPGRFLKKCPDTEKWVELSLKEAATRTSQAMAYTVREIAKHKKKRRSLRLQQDRGASVESSTEYGSRLESNNNSNASVENTGTVSVPSAASASVLGGEVSNAANLASRRNDTGELSGTANNNRVSVPAAGLQQQLLQIQLQQLGASSMPSAATLSTTTNAGAPLNSLLLLLAQAQQQQQQQAQLQLQQQLLLRQLLGQLPAQRSTLQNSNNSSDKTPVPSQNSATTLMELLRRSNLAQNQFPTHHSGPINTQALLSLLSILQSQSPTATAPTQFPWPAQQFNQIQQNQSLQVQHNQQLLASLLTRTNPPLVPPSLPPSPQQPLSMLQQQISGLASNSASNPDASIEVEMSSSSKKKAEDVADESSDK